MSENDSYHTVHGMKWPNCISCGSENTTVVPKTGEWTCEDCGRQWHTDETAVEDGDADEIPECIGEMVRAVFSELKGAESDLDATHTGVSDSRERVSFSEDIVGNRYLDTRHDEVFTVTEIKTHRTRVAGQSTEVTDVFFEWDSGSSGHQNVEDFQTYLNAGTYEEVAPSGTETVKDGDSHE